MPELQFLKTAIFPRDFKSYKTEEMLAFFLSKVLFCLDY